MSLGHAQTTVLLTTTAASTVGQIIPPAPKTTALGTFGYLPVDLNTGAVDLSVPLVQLQSGALQVPVALRYKTTVVKVSELLSWVGQGPPSAAIVYQPEYGFYKALIVLAAAHAHTLAAHQCWHDKRVAGINYHLTLTLSKYYFTMR